MLNHIFKIIKFKYGNNLNISNTTSKLSMRKVTGMSFHLYLRYEILCKFIFRQYSNCNLQFMRKILNFLKNVKLKYTLHTLYSLDL